jgi:type IV pilus assembly protein PilM
LVSEEIGLAKNQITTVDIGTNSVKILQLELTQTGIMVVNYGVKSYPRQSAAEKIPDEVLLDTLSQLMRERLIQTKPVAIAIPRLSVTVKDLTGLPTSATDEDIEKMVPIQVDLELPFAIADAAYSTYNLQRSPEGISLEVVATKKSSVRRYMDIAEETGLRLKAIIPSAFATYGAIFDQSKEELTGRTIAMADIGAGITDFCIIQHGRLAFSRSFTFGGNNLTQLYESEYGLSFPEAEERKLKEADLKSAEEDALANRWAKSLVMQITQSLRAFSGEGPTNGISRLRLCGGGSQVPGLDEYLADALGIEVILWNPMQDAAGQSVEEGLQSRLSVALGLGIIGADGEKRTPTVNANLLPKEISERAERARRKVIAIIATAAAILILAGAGLGFTSWQRSRAEQREGVARELESLERKVETIKAKAALENSILMQRMMAPYVTPLEILREMSSRLPDRKKIALTNLNIDKKGKVTMGVEANSHADVSEMIQILNGMKLLDKVKLFDEVKYGAISRVTKEKRPILQVQIACTLNVDAMQKIE